MSDLVFFKPFDGSADLVFGDSAAPVEQHVDATLDDVFDALTFEAVQIPDAKFEAAFVLAEMTFEGEAEYKSRAQRPIVAKALSEHQVAAPVESGVSAPHQVASPATPSVDSEWQKASPCSNTAIGSHTDATHLRQGSRSRHQDAQRLALGNQRSGFQDGDRTRRNAASTRFQQATPHISAGRLSRHQDADRRPRSALRQSYQEARSLHYALREGFERASPYDISAQNEYQKAKRPDAGIYVPPVEPPTPPGYEPTGDLLFAKLRDGTANLIFNDDGSVRTVIVPVRSVYMIINNATLRRVSDNAYILPISMSLKIDADSWTWGFSASIPGSAQALVEPTDYATPVELEVSINGHAYRVLVEAISRERTFGSTSLSISGRGKSAYLDSPYAPTMNFGNTQSRTARQLMDDALTFNNVSIGWDVDWNITDWLVPAGAWSHQGTYISALKRIAEAGGAYIQPHPTEKRIVVASRYPTAPWEWDSTTPDFELPSAVTTREGIEWIDAADYNGIYVSGEAMGVLAHVKRTGTAGDKLATMIVDPLATHADMARQRGIAVLGNTGRIANVTLRLPVLESTGAIQPGAMVRYTDGAENRIGLVRSTQVDVGYPEVWQSIGVETHA